MSLTSPSLKSLTKQETDHLFEEVRKLVFYGVVVIKVVVVAALRNFKRKSPIFSLRKPEMIRYLLHAE